MTKLDVAIIDYQMGNLRSVQKAFEHVGVTATVTSDPDQVATANRVVLPGVGAFGDAINELKARHLTQPIVDCIAAGKPFLGICLGLQLLFEIGTEGREQRGLGVLAGRVERFNLPREFKVPHMGWNQVMEEQAGCPLLVGVPPTAHFYFVHSYYVVPSEPQVNWLSCEYGTRFCAAVWRDNVFATQFHPEKSQHDGLKLLQNFASI